MKDINCTFLENEKFCKNEKVKKSFFGFGKRYCCYYNNTDKQLCKFQHYGVIKGKVIDEKYAEKERAYRLYNMNLFEFIEINPYSTFVERFPGGWITHNVFIPYNEEYKEFAFSPTDKKIELMCKCGHRFNVFVKEEFQGNTYFCINCKNNIVYEDV